MHEFKALSLLEALDQGGPRACLRLLHPSEQHGHCLVIRVCAGPLHLIQRALGEVEVEAKVPPFW